MQTDGRGRPRTQHNAKERAWNGNKIEFVKTELEKQTFHFGRRILGKRTASNKCIKPESQNEYTEYTH